MWRRNDGFLMAELLLSLSAWLIIAGVFFPLVMRAVDQSRQVEQDFAGTLLLYEALQKAVIEEQPPPDRVVKKGNTVYELFSKEGSAQTEVCLRYEGIFNQTYEKCEVFE